jgi:hypothetical protein
VYGAVVCSFDAVSLFYLELYVKLSIYLSVTLRKARVNGAEYRCLCKKGLMQDDV